MGSPGSLGLVMSVAKRRELPVSSRKHGTSIRTADCGLRTTVHPMDRSTRNGIVFALLAALFWGVSGAIAADAFTHVSPARVAEVRAIVTALVFIPFAYVRGALSPRGGLLGFALLGVNLAIVNVTFYWAIDRLGVGPGATIQFLAPIFVLLWMVVAQHRHVSPTVWLAAGIAVAGVSLITEAWNLEGGDWIGVVWGLISAVAFASYLIFGEYLGRSHRAITIVTWGFVFASIIWMFTQPLWTFPTDLSAKVWIELLWIGIVGTALPFLFGFSALRARGVRDRRGHLNHRAGVRCNRCMGVARPVPQRDSDDRWCDGARGRSSHPALGSDRCGGFSRVDEVAGHRLVASGS